MADGPPDDADAAPSGEGAVARLKALPSISRERLAVLVEAALDRVFDTPFDIRNAYEAMQAIKPNDSSGTAQGAVRRAAEWGATRAATRIGARYGTKVAGRAAAPIGMAVELGVSARDGIRELQVLTSFLVGRFRADAQERGLEPARPDRELIRRTVLAIYLEPKRRPDLRVGLHRRTLAVAKRWTMNSVPLTGRRQSTLSRQRVEAIATLELGSLLEDWRRAQALDARLAASNGRVLEARLASDTAPPADG